MTKAPDKAPVARAPLYPAGQSDSTEGIVRIDLDVVGPGEISAAISLVRTVCPVLYMETYGREHSRRQIVYVRVAASGAQRATDALRHYGFKVIEIRRESDSEKSAFLVQN